MNYIGILTFFVYSLCLAFVIILTYKKQRSDTDFVLANRSLGKWLTALSAHASDMSDWLFMGYPMLIFTTGIFSIWVAIGLTVFMFLNWQIVALKIRSQTENMGNLTLFSYFESKLNDGSGSIKLFSAIISFLFLTVYISAELVGFGLLVYSLFGVHYSIGIIIGLIIVDTYVIFGGYRSIAWIDLFQGTFLFAVIIIIPLIILHQIGGFAPTMKVIKIRHLQDSLFPDFSCNTITQIVYLSVGWGIGYFGQPHIITKFMGIKNPQDIRYSKYIGMSWQILALGGATLIGMLGIALFPSGLANPQLVALETVKVTLPSVFFGLILCAILAATTNVMAAQILVTASSMAEDVYKGYLRKKATHIQLLWVSRFCIIIISVIVFIIAYYKIDTIYRLVWYAWSGLGASFGPLLLFSLYSNRLTKKDALCGLVTGGFIAAIWPCFNKIANVDIPAIIPAFILSFMVMYIMVSMRGKQEKQNMG